MRVPLSWLTEYAPVTQTTQGLADRLTMTGTMVEAVHHHGPPTLEHFVVARVLTAEQHPDADRLKVCTVDVGETEPAQIVCGAPNVAAGQEVLVARPGSVMPDGTKLKKAKLRGVESQGMILAEDELAIGNDHAGIMVLDDAAAPGTPLQQEMPWVATDVLELEITPNRPDCLGVYGVAREVHAATGGPLAPPPWAGVELGEPTGIEGVSIEVRDSERCPRFTAIAYENVTIAPSPAWLKARLSAAGQRPINNVVDITNYVMLLTGQPLHAFDLDRVAGGTLIIRGATENEQVTTLDGQVRELPAEAMVIDDADGPTSIAGIMGGERSEVQPDTTRVLMEVANWDGVAIHATSQKLTLRSEASGRNEKGLSPEQCVEAQAVAQRLMLELTGATLVPGFIDIGGNGPAPRTIRLRDARVTHLLGMSIALTEQVRVLEALGFEVVRVPDGLDVTVPHFRRNDVTREADLVEEVARLTALEDLPATLPRLRPGARLTPAQQVRRRAEDVLVGRGVFEIAGWSLVAPELLDKLRLPADAPMRDTVNLVNPMSAEQSILRPTLLGSLLDVARHNLARGRDRVALFDSGTVYRNDPARTDGLVDEHHGLGCLLAGPIAPTGWDSPAPPPAGFFAVKGLVAAVLDTLRVPWEVQASDAWPFLHPGRSALVRSGERRLGFVGELHPLVAREWDLPSAAAFALDLGVVAELAIEVPEFADLTSFPPVRQDLSLLIGERTAAEVIAGVRQAGGRLLRSVTLFDRFARDEQVSIALHLEFAAPDRTLTDDEVDGLRTKILDALAQQGVVRVPDDLPTVLVAGASGFAGALAARLLHRHPGFELTAITSRSDAGRRLDDLYPHHRVPLVLDALNLDEAGPVDAAIVGYPHAASAPVVAQMRERGIRVVDLSADFRLRDTATYTQWYGNEHPAPQLIPDAVYGLPERNRDAISRADLVACPGCFPTAAILALGPLADAGLLDDVVIDAKTGVSGAGREATQTTHFVSVDENVAAYKVGAHRHTPEMEQELGVPVTFVPHLVPVDQGEQLSCYLTLRDGADAARARELLEAAYAGEPFVELVERPPGMRDVRETNVCRISVHDAGRKVVVLAAIDNLWKGTASQAVQCLNLMFGLDETAGIAA